jgi:hypothetical protein
MGFWPFGGSSESKPAPEKQAEPAAAPKKKICCACPDTKVLALLSIEAAVETIVHDLNRHMCLFYRYHF